MDGSNGKNVVFIVALMVVVCLTFTIAAVLSHFGNLPI